MDFTENRNKNSSESFRGSVGYQLIEGGLDVFFFFAVVAFTVTFDESRHAILFSDCGLTWGFYETFSGLAGYKEHNKGVTLILGAS